jgi:hypothetical protein
VHLNRNVKSLIGQKFSTINGLMLILGLTTMESMEPRGAALYLWVLPTSGTEEDAAKTNPTIANPVANFILKITLAGFFFYSNYPENTLLPVAIWSRN